MQIITQLKTSLGILFTWQWDSPYWDWFSIIK